MPVYVLAHLVESFQILAQRFDVVNALEDLGFNVYLLETLRRTEVSGGKE
jgi:hypothetical protein